MKTTRVEQIKNTCNLWHSGQWSALYQFGSSGIYLVENHLRYLNELQQGRDSEYYSLYPVSVSAKDDNKLKSAQNWFIKQGNKNGINTYWGNHNLYGYKIPFCTGSHGEVINLKLPI